MAMRLLSAAGRLRVAVRAFSALSPRSPSFSLYAQRRPIALAFSRLSSSGSGGGGDEGPASSGRAAEESAGEEADAASAFGQALRQQILTHALLHVDELGWSDEALAAGAVDAGLPVVSKGMFPRGAAHLIETFLDQSAAAMEQAASTDSFLQAAVAERVALLFEIRLSSMQPYRHNWAAALAVLAKPSNVPHSIEHLASFVDRVCRLVGEEAMNTQFWMRRASLAVAFTSSEMFLLQDESENCAETKAFVRRSVDEALGLERFAPLLDGVLTRVVQQFQQKSGSPTGGTL